MYRRTNSLLGTNSAVLIKRPVRTPDLSRSSLHPSDIPTVKRLSMKRNQLNSPRNPNIGKTKPPGTLNCQAHVSRCSANDDYNQQRTRNSELELAIARRLISESDSILWRRTGAADILNRVSEIRSWVVEGQQQHESEGSDPSVTEHKESFPTLENDRVSAASGSTDEESHSCHSNASDNSEMQQTGCQVLSIEKQDDPPIVVENIPYLESESNFIDCHFDDVTFQTTRPEIVREKYSKSKSSALLLLVTACTVFGMVFVNDLYPPYWTTPPVSFWTYFLGLITSSFRYLLLTIPGVCSR